MIVALLGVMRTFPIVVALVASGASCADPALDPANDEGEAEQPATATTTPALTLANTDITDGV